MQRQVVEKLFEIIFEDNDLLVVNKPAGLVCHPTKNGEMSSLIGRARLHLNSSPQPLDTKPYLINRLDRETNGVVLIAKNPETAGELGKSMENRRVHKEYLTLVHGHVCENHGLIDAPLGKDERSIVAVKDCVRADGSPARTEFFVERIFSRKINAPGEAQSPFSLLRIIPHTGRKHQIRIHLAHLGYPIVGDKLYGGDEDCYLALAQNRLTGVQRVRLIFENHALHARSLRFDWRDRSMTFTCEPERWFTQFLITDSAKSV